MSDMAAELNALQRNDPGDEVRAAYPDAQADEDEVKRLVGQWTRGWERRFGGLPRRGAPP